MDHQIYIQKAKADVNFTIVLNETIEDNRISKESLGVLVSILSLPDDWIVRKIDLQKRFNIGRRIVDKCFEELKQAGYMEEFDNANMPGVFNGKTYVFYAVSRKLTDVQNVHTSHATDVQNVHRTDVQNVHLLNKHNTTKKTYKEKFEKPTLEQVYEYAMEKHGLTDSQASQFANKFWNFYESKGWLVGKSPMKSWQSAVAGTWKDKAIEIKGAQVQYTKSTDIKFKFN